jgi:uncharacterized membrane protein
MQRFYRFFRSWLRTALQSLAFLPLPMMLGALVIGVLLFHLETNTGISLEITELLPSTILSSQATARSILTIIIGGLITLTAFTFTQMMTLFSQVANSYSPRLLPIFTGSRALQFVMGSYLATIILTLIVLLSIRGNDDGYVPNLSVLLCIILGVLCLVMFLYFVTTISNKIQVTNIIEEVYLQGVRAIDREVDRPGFSERSVPTDFMDWYAIPSPIGGFIGTVDYHSLSKLAHQYETRFYLSADRGQFVPENLPIAYCSSKIPAEAVRKALKAVSPIHKKFTDWHLPPVRLLTEIAIKAMSPGINDPGTAIDVLDRLTGLLMRLMRLPQYNHFQAEEDKGGEIWLATHQTADILTGVMQELRQYCKADPLVVRRLFLMLFHLLASAGDGFTYTRVIRGELEALLADARANLTNVHDRRILAREIMQKRTELKQLFEDTDFLLDAHLGEIGLAIGKQDQD